MQTTTAKSPTANRKPLRKGLKYFLISLLLICPPVYVALSPLCSMWLYNYLLFFPWKYPTGYYQFRAASNIEPRDVWIPIADGLQQKLHGWYYEKPHAKRTVIVHHGQGGNVSLCRIWAELFLGCDANVLLYDYEGFGRSGGTVSIEAVRRDGLAAFDYLCNIEKIAKEKIVNCGESLGTGVASYVTEKRKAAGLILFSPYASVFECGQQRFPILYAYPRFMFPKIELECRTALKGAHPPAMLVHGTEDLIIPVSHSDELYRIASKPINYYRLPNRYHDPLDWDFHPALTGFLNGL